MSRIQGTFVHAPDQSHDATIAALRRAARRARVLRGYWDVTMNRALPWVRLYAAATEALESLCQGISADLARQVIVVDCPSNVDALAYSHYHCGALRRSLISGGVEEGVWSRVAGEPEEWELSSWLANELPAEGESHSGSLSELSDLVFEHFRLPGLDQEVHRFGPAWPLRMFGLFW